MTPLTITEHTDAAVTRLHVAGELDYATTPDLIDTASAHLDRDDLRELHLDFQHLTWCDSSGLAGLLLIHRRTTAAGVGLRLLNRPATLDRILTMTGTLDYLTTSPAEESDRPESTG